MIGFTRAATPPAARSSVFANRNFRLFFAGQLVSVSGTWMQNVAQGWLVLQLTDSGSALGTIAALQALPFLVGSPFGGLAADRLDRRRLLLGVQTASAVLAALFAILTATHLITVELIGVLAVATGCVNAVEIPTRQSFLMEMVGREGLPAAIPLTNVVANGGRLVGPAVAGVLIATVGVASCFALNALSFAAVLAALLCIRSAELHPTPALARARGQLTAGFGYARRTPAIRRPLVSVALVGVTAWQFPVSLPLLARYTFDHGAPAYGAMAAAMAVGAVVGGLAVARRRPSAAPRLGAPTLIFGAAVILSSAAPTIESACVLLVLTGAAGVTFSATASTTIQLGSAPEMHGRMIALYTIAFSGTTLVGGPLVGTIGEVAGPRTALLAGGAVAVASGLWQLGAQRRDVARLRRWR